MYCPKCGTNNEENSNICINCGNELKNTSSNANTNNSSTYNFNLEKEENKKQATLSLIIGIVSVILCFFINILVLPLSIVGIVLGVKSKGEGTSGIILNVASIIIPAITIILFISIFIKSMKLADYKGTYKCDLTNSEIKEDNSNYSFEIQLLKNNKFSIHTIDKTTEINGDYFVNDTEYDRSKKTLYYYLELTSKTESDIQGTNQTKVNITLEINQESKIYIKGADSSEIYMCVKN